MQMGKPMIRPTGHPQGIGSPAAPPPEMPAQCRGLGQ